METGPVGGHDHGVCAFHGDLSVPREPCPPAGLSLPQGQAGMCLVRARALCVTRASPPGVCTLHLLQRALSRGEELRALTRGPSIGWGCGHARSSLSVVSTRPSSPAPEPGGLGVGRTLPAAEGHLPASVGVLLTGAGVSLFFQITCASEVGQRAGRAGRRGIALPPERMRV